ncbi:MAG: hemin uptake protein HemP [Cellvibrionaceae bacterium]
MSTTIDMTEKSSTDITPRRVKSSDLLAGDKTIIIDHAGSEYELRITRSHKLILTK